MLDKPLHWAEAHLDGLEYILFLYGYVAVVIVLIFGVLALIVYGLLKLIWGYNEILYFRGMGTDDYGAFR